MQNYKHFWDFLGVKVLKKSPLCQYFSKKKNCGKPPSFVQNTHFGGEVAENQDFIQVKSNLRKKIVNISKI